MNPDFIIGAAASTGIGILALSNKRMQKIFSIYQIKFLSDALGICAALLIAGVFLLNV